MSSRKRRIRYATGARSDLANALRFSQQRWGERQRAIYRTTLRNTIAVLADEPDIGRSCEEFAPGLRSHPVGSHVIYYLALQDELFVVRVLHGRRDPNHEEWRDQSDEA